MLDQSSQFLELDNCPQCHVTSPLLVRIWQTFDDPELAGRIKSSYAVFLCTKCGELIFTVANRSLQIERIWPEPETIPAEIPGRAKKTLADAIKTKTVAPSLSILACSRALDFMLREKNITGATLYIQIEAAAKQNILIPGMVDWAHEIRLAANSERHPDNDDATPEEARQCIDFALAVAQNLFVLPARVRLGQQRAKQKKP